MRPRAIKRPRRLPRGLGAKLFLSHFLVVLVAVLTLLMAVLIIAPIFDRAFEPALLLGSADDTPAEAFRQTLLYSLLAAGVVATGAAALASLLVSRR